MKINKIHFKMITCYLLFDGGMWISKTLHPLYWNKESHLSLFSISYTTMAFAGVFSFYWSSIISYLGSKRSFTCGVLLYSFGIFLRGIPPNIFTAMLSGFTAGIGASFTILSMKNWIFYFKDEDKSKVISIVVNSEKSAQLLGTFLAGWVVFSFAALGFYSIGSSLIFASLLPLLALFFIPDFDKLKDSNSKIGKVKNFTLLEIYRENPLIICLFMPTIFIMGIYSASLLPLIPLYLNAKEISILGVSSVMTLGLALSLVLNFIFCKFITKENCCNIYLFCSVLFAIFIFFIFKSDNTFALIISCIAYLFLRTLMSTLFMMIETTLLTQEKTPSLFGIHQSIFLSADIIGGFLAPIVFANKEKQIFPLIISLLVIYNGVVIFFTKYLKRSSHQYNQI